jgi:glycosyltransferase involved in cell wall biosynthesis
VSELNIFTLEFPYGYGDIFLEGELVHHIGKYDKINVIPLSRHKEKVSNLAPEINELHWKDLKSPNWIEMCLIAFIELFLIPSFKKRLYFIKTFRTRIAELKLAQKLADWIEADLNPNKSSVCYTYWVSEWTLALTILKYRGYKFPFISRCGGFDIYDERHPGNYFPFRFVNYNYLDKLYTNSLFSLEYLKSFGLITNKVELAYLGTKDYSFIDLVPSDRFVIASCSSLIPLKRVELIAKAVKDIPNVEWHHFGGGPQLSEVMKIIDNSDNVYIHPLEADNPFIRFCKNHFIDLFINVSTTEGLPVTIQEAISFGIPVMATPAGGSPEVVNQHTGILIKMNINPVELNNAIIAFVNSGKTRDRNYRKKVREFWSHRFAESRVYSIFAATLQSMAKK